MSEYPRGGHPNSRKNLLRGERSDLLDPYNGSLSGLWTWVRHGRLPDKPWAGEVLGEVEQLVADEVSRIGGLDQLEAIDRSDLDVLRVAAVAQRLAVRQWQADGLPVSRKTGMPAYLRRDWAKFVSLERSALRHLRARHGGKPVGPPDLALVLSGVRHE